MRGIFSVYDRRAIMYGRCFDEVSPVNATRSFEAACGSVDSNLMRYPEDFELHQVAQFDEEKGVVHPLVPAVCVATAQEMVRRVNQLATVREQMLSGRPDVTA